MADAEGHAAVVTAAADDRQRPNRRQLESATARAAVALFDSSSSLTYSDTV